MTSRRSFMAASLAVPMIVTLEPKHAAALQSPPPVPRHEQVAQSSVPSSSGKEPGGVLAFTGQPLDKQTATGLAALVIGAVTVWVAKGEKT